MAATTSRHSLGASPSSAASTVGSIAEATERFLLAPNNYQALWTYAEKQMTLGQQLLDQGNVDTAYHKLKAAHVCYAYIIAFSVAASKSENDKLESQSRQVYALKKTAKDLLARKGGTQTHAITPDTVSAASSGSSHKRRHRQQRPSSSSNFSLHSQNNPIPELLSNYDPLAGVAGWTANNPSRTTHAPIKSVTNKTSDKSTLRHSHAIPILMQNSSGLGNARFNDKKGGGDVDNNYHCATTTTTTTKRQSSRHANKPDKQNWPSSPQSRVENQQNDDDDNRNSQPPTGNALYDIMFNSETESRDAERFGSLTPSSLQKVAIGLSSPPKPTGSAVKLPPLQFDWKTSTLAQSSTKPHTSTTLTSFSASSSSSSSSSSSTRTLTQQNARTTKTSETSETQKNRKLSEANTNNKRNLFASLGTATGREAKNGDNGTVNKSVPREMLGHGHAIVDDEDDNNSDDDEGENDDRDCLYEDDELDDDEDDEDVERDGWEKTQSTPLRSLFTRSESLIDAFSERVRTSSSRLKDDLMGRVKKISSTLARNSSDTSKNALSACRRRKSDALGTTTSVQNANKTALRQSSSAAGEPIKIHVCTANSRHSASGSLADLTPAPITSRRRAPVAPAFSVDTNNYSTKPQLAKPACPPLQRRMSRDQARTLLAEALTREKLDGWAPYDDFKRAKPNSVGPTLQRSSTEPVLPIIASASSSSFKRRMSRNEFEKKKFSLAFHTQEANRRLMIATSSTSLPVLIKKSLCDVIKESGFEVKAEERVPPQDPRPYEQKVEEFLLGFNLKP